MYSQYLIPVVVHSDLGSATGIPHKPLPFVPCQGAAPNPSLKTGTGGKEVEGQDARRLFIGLLTQGMLEKTRVERN